VSVGGGHDTATFAVQTLRRWWEQVGRATYPRVGRLLVCADAGGGRLRWLRRRPSGETGGMRTRRPRPTPVPPSAFAGFRFPPDVIVLAVRWYLRFGLSYRDLEELLAERGIQADHVTIYRWMLRFTPLLADAARPCRHRVGDRWQVDETC
jgi:hypothetical protein